jgi:transposase
MPRTLVLAPDERAKLDRLRATSPKPYLRERASALLQIADGRSAHQVARTGLLQPRDPDTVYAWLDRYLAAGIAGLAMRPGRGRKPAFSPPLP